MNQERLMKIISSPHISEKATVIADRDRQYVFRVTEDASKPEIKQAVETLFKVKVENVQVVNVRGKMKRLGRNLGKRSNYKKAYVSLAEGHDIDFTGPQ